MKTETIETVWEYLIEGGYATEEELKLVTYINGYNMESINSVIYARTSYEDIEQLKNEEGF